MLVYLTSMRTPLGKQFTLRKKKNVLARSTKLHAVFRSAQNKIRSQKKEEKDAEHAFKRSPNGCTYLNGFKIELFSIRDNYVTPLWGIRLCVGFCHLSGFFKWIRSA